MVRFNLMPTLNYDPVTPFNDPPIPFTGTPITELTQLALRHIHQTLKLNHHPKNWKPLGHCHSNLLLHHGTPLFTPNPTPRPIAPLPSGATPIDPSNTATVAPCIEAPPPQAVPLDQAIALPFPPDSLQYPSHGYLQYVGAASIPTPEPTDQDPTSLDYWFLPS